MDLAQHAAINAAANEVLWEKLGSGDSHQVKEAADAISDFTRTKMREESFLDKIMPPLPLSNSDLDRSLSTDKPVRFEELEPESPGAASVPLLTQPVNFYFYGRRYQVAFERTISQRYMKDVDELRTYDMDIRQVISDNTAKDMLAERDARFIRAVNAVLYGAGLIVPTSGIAQHRTVGTMSREALWDMMKTMPQSPSRLESHTCLTNNITIKDVCKFGRDEMGGDLAQKIMIDGFAEENFLNNRWLVTIKQDLVPTNRVYNFADPRFIGKHYTLQEPTLYAKVEAFMLEFFMYDYSGAAFGHTDGITAHDFV